MELMDVYFQALHAVGILNYQTLEASGESWFLDHCMERMKAPVVFDVGANAGDYTREVLKRAPWAHVFAFEPHPKTFLSLAESCESPNVLPLNLALGADDGELPFFDYQDGDGSAHASLYRDVIETIHHKPSEEHRVSMRRLADVADEYDVRHIDLLKIDTEGHEFAVLEGAEPLIRAGEVDVIHFEFNEMNVISRRFFKDFWDFLPEYDFFRLLPKGLLQLSDYVPAICEVFAYQNIVCTRKDRPLF